MYERLKYSLNGVYKCHNFAQHVENDNFPNFPIGDAALFHWYIRFDTEVINDTTFIYPFISSDDREDKIQVFVYFNILKKDGSFCLRNENRNVYLEWDEGCMGKYMNIEEVLDEENGYLDEGTLTVEYGLQMNSVEDVNRIWMFNCFDLFFDWQDQDNMFDFIIRRGSYLYGHKQIIKLHSKKISDSNKDWIRVPKSITDDDFVVCLQITHGARPHMTVGELEIVLKTAFHFGFSNTVRYCEQQLIEMDAQIKVKLTRKIKLAVKFNMERYLNHSIKQIKSPERLMRILKRLNIEKMSSESMKTFSGKYLELIDSQK